MDWLKNSKINQNSGDFVKPGISGGENDAFVSVANETT